MNIQEQHRLENIQKLDLPNHLFQKLFGNDVTDTIKQYLGEINHFYTQGWPDNPSYFSALSDKIILPLWECGNCIFAVDLSNDKNEYIQFNVESPEEYQVNGISIYSSLLAVIEL